jgi:hypothetical protein
MRERIRHTQKGDEGCGCVLHFDRLICCLIEKSECDVMLSMMLMRASVYVYAKKKNVENAQHTDKTIAKYASYKAKVK